MSELPDIYVSKHALTHMDDTGMLSIASFANGDMRECYTPKSILKEVMEALKDMVESYEHEASIDNPALLKAKEVIKKIGGNI